MEFNMTSIKLKEKEETEFKEKKDWRKIKEDEECCKEYNNILRDMKEHEPEMTYNDFFDATIRAGKRTALLPQEEPTGWFLLSQDILMPAIRGKNKIVHTLRHPCDLSPDETRALQMKLDAITKINKDLIITAKTRWYEKL